MNRLLRLFDRMACWMPLPAYAPQSPPPYVSDLSPAMQAQCDRVATNAAKFIVDLFKESYPARKPMKHNVNSHVYKSVRSAFGDETGTPNTWAERIIETLDADGFAIVPKTPTGGMVNAVHIVGGSAFRAIWRDAITEYQRGLTEEGVWPPINDRQDGGFHWFHAERASSPAIAQWMGERWHVINEGPISPVEMQRRGWEYLGPVSRRPHSKYLDT